MKRILLMVLLSVLLTSMFIPAMARSEAGFVSWREQIPALAALTAYVDDVTNEASEDFIPVEDRIAVFDMDGTLYGELAPIYVEWWMYVHRVNEDPSFIPDAPEKAVADQIVEAAKTGHIPEDLERDHAVQNARVYAGMTVDAYKQYVRDFCGKSVVGFDDMTYKDAFYKPMIEVVRYLTEHDFTVYICSGTDRFLCRELADGVLPIPDNHVIGMDVMLKARGQRDTDGLDYTYTSEDEVIRTDELLIKSVKMNKVSMIAQEIGQKPVLAFGNSSGDESMAMYVTDDNPYKSMAFMLIADDAIRDYGDTEKAAKLEKKWKGYGWEVISMKNDFLTIYGDNVVRTNK